ncbi:MAG TPA: hypothetical protein VGO43_11380 [Pyrinomonadaceae bacterium]|jgi:hypothetical protein|nr:hypothetical protein [Pyrinomonadaceae bacterium]
MSKVSRRKFIGTAALTAGVVVGMDGAVLGQIRSVPSGGKAAVVGVDALSRLGWSSFLPFVNTDFTFGQGGNAVTLRLTDMTDSRPLDARRARKAGQENFVMKFTGSGRAPLKDGTYEVNHFNLGDFQLFITADGQAGKLNVYHAVINRVVVID